MQKDHDLDLVCELHKKALNEICKLEKSFNRMGCYIILLFTDACGRVGIGSLFEYLSMQHKIKHLHSGLLGF